MAIAQQAQRKTDVRKTTTQRNAWGIRQGVLFALLWMCIGMLGVQQSLAQERVQRFSPEEYSVEADSGAIERTVTSSIGLFAVLENEVGVTAFGNDIFNLINTPQDIVLFDIGVPEELTAVDEAVDSFAGNFIFGNNEEVYWIDNSDNKLKAYVLEDGSVEVIGDLVPESTSEGWTDMETDYTTGITYVTTYDNASGQSRLYSLDPENADLTFIGDFHSGINIAFAIDDQGQGYGHSITDDVILLVDLETAESEVLGPTGIDANFAQSMTFDSATGQLLMAAYEGSLAQMPGSFRLVDRETGATTLIGPIGVAGEANELGWVATPGVEGDPLQIASVEPEEVVQVRPGEPIIYVVSVTDEDGKPVEGAEIEVGGPDWVNGTIDETGGGEYVYEQEVPEEIGDGEYILTFRANKKNFIDSNEKERRVSVDTSPLIVENVDFLESVHSDLPKDAAPGERFEIQVTIRNTAEEELQLVRTRAFSETEGVALNPEYTSMSSLGIHPVLDPGQSVTYELESHITNWPELSVMYAGVAVDYEMDGAGSTTESNELTEIEIFVPAEEDTYTIPELYELLRQDDFPTNEVIATEYVPYHRDLRCRGCQGILAGAQFTGLWTAAANIAEAIDTAAEAAAKKIGKEVLIDLFSSAVTGSEKEKYTYIWGVAGTSSHEAGEVDQLDNVFFTNEPPGWKTPDHGKPVKVVAKARDLYDFVDDGILVERQEFDFFPILEPLSFVEKTDPIGDYEYWWGQGQEWEEDSFYQYGVVNQHWELYNTGEGYFLLESYDVELINLPLVGNLINVILGGERSMLVAKAEDLDSVPEIGSTVKVKGNTRELETGEFVTTPSNSPGGRTVRYIIEAEDLSFSSGGYANASDLKEVGGQLFGKATERFFEPWDSGFSVDTEAGSGEEAQAKALNNLSTTAEVELHIYDSAGRHTGPTYDDDGNRDGINMEIPGTFYDPVNAYVLFDSLRSEYTYKVVSTGEGSSGRSLSVSFANPADSTISTDTIVNRVGDSPGRGLLTIEEDEDFGYVVPTVQAKVQMGTSAWSLGWLDEGDDSIYFWIGNITGERNVEDIEAGSIVLNNQIAPESTEIVSRGGQFDGKVLQVTFQRQAAIETLPSQEEGTYSTSLAFDFEGGENVRAGLPVEVVSEGVVEITDTIADQELIVDGVPFEVNLGEVFDAPRGEDLTYKAASTVESVAAVSIKGGSLLQVEPVGSGVAVVSVEAKGLSGQAVATSFEVRVEGMAIDVERNFIDPTDETSYRLVGLPGQIDADVAATLSGEAGSAWRAFRETGADGESAEDYLDEYDGSDAFHFAPGRGFWLLSRDAWEVDQTVDAVELTEDGFTTVPLHEGWNIFSNPLDQPVAWDATLSLAANEGLTVALWQWDGSWQGADTLQSARTGEAYYLFNDGDLEQLTLQHPAFAEDEEQGDLIAAAQADRAELELIAETRSAETDERQEAARLALGHTAGDAIMHRLPPAHFAAAQLSVRSELLDAPLGRVLEAAPEEGDGLAFHVELTGVAEGEAAYLYPEGLSAFEGEQVVLVNSATGARHTLADYSAAEPLRIRVEEGHLTRGSGEAEDTLPLQLLIGDQAFVDGAAERPDELAFGAVYPNPSDGQVTIEVAVPETMALQVELYNVLGQQVGLLHSGELAPGVHELRWDGRTTTGAEAASGVYLVRLVGPDGQQDTARLTRVR